MRVVLDEVVSHAMPGRPRQIEIDRPGQQPVEMLLRSAGVPVGLIGYIVQGKTVLKPDSLLESDDPIELFGIYDGG